jgi:hypothetical protein
VTPASTIVSRVNAPPSVDRSITKPVSPVLLSIHARLIAEDDAASRASTAELLTGAGFQVQLARDGADALEQLAGLARSDGLPDVLLTDLDMPRVTGRVWASGGLVTGHRLLMQVGIALLIVSLFLAGRAQGEGLADPAMPFADIAGHMKNWLLLGKATARLRRRGFEVLLHEHVPPNDGGISLGQAAVAGERLARGL